MQSQDANWREQRNEEWVPPSLRRGGSLLIFIEYRNFYLFFFS